MILLAEAEGICRRNMHFKPAKKLHKWTIRGVSKGRGENKMGNALVPQ